jgi:hypothetical protein
VEEIVDRGHQVMVFVHARKETVKSALALREAALAEGVLEKFSCEDHQQWSIFRREIGQSRNKEMKQLFDSGFGIHHAGMLRSDRNMMERMFEARAIKVGMLITNCMECNNHFPGPRVHGYSCMGRELARACRLVYMFSQHLRFNTHFNSA